MTLADVAKEFEDSLRLADVPFYLVLVETSVKLRSQAKDCRLV